MECECKNWARTDGWLTKHHPGCAKYDLKGDAVEIITDLVGVLKRGHQMRTGCMMLAGRHMKELSFVLGKKYNNQYT